MASVNTLILDFGGQGGRALLIDADGGLVFDTARERHARVDGDRVEQDAEALVEDQEALLRAVADACLDRDISIDHVALTVQRGSIVCWDRDSGAPLSPVISWRDRRGMAGMHALADQADAIKRRTGLRFSPYGGASKLAWCLAELEPVRRAADDGRLAFGPLGSFLAARLVGTRPPRTDDTLAQRTLLWSRETFDWDPWLLARFDLPAVALPRVGPSRTSLGRVAALPGAPPLSLLVGDQNALAFLAGQPDHDTLYINLGTGGFLLRPHAGAPFTREFQLSLLDRVRGGRWALEASVHGVASALEWLSHEAGEAIARERFDGLRARVDEPPLFINTLDGLGSPWWTPGPEPAFIDGDTGLDARVLGVFESIAFLVRANVDAMGPLVAPPARVVVCGGLSRVDDLCALIADALGTDLLRLRSAEGTALGAWCMLHKRALPDAAFERVRAGAAPALERRYARWLEHVEQAVREG